MNIRCPDCRGILTIEDGKGRCGFHEGEYEVLYASSRVVATDLQFGPSQTSGNLSGPPGNERVPSGNPQIRCVFHPNAEANHRCHQCNRPICETCTFTFSNLVYLCPDCVRLAAKGMTGKRKNLMIWSWVLAIWSTLWVFILFVAFALMSKEDWEILSQLSGLMTIIPSLIGLALGLGALDKRLSNPLSLKLPIIWNGILLGALLLLCFIGLMS